MIVSSYAVNASATSSYFASAYSSGTYKQHGGPGNAIFLTNKSAQEISRTTSVSQQFVGYERPAGSSNGPPVNGHMPANANGRLHGNAMGELNGIAKGEQKNGENSGEQKQDALSVSKDARERLNKERGPFGAFASQQAPGLFDPEKFVDSQLEMKAKILEMLLLQINGSKHTNSAYPFKDKLEARLDDVKSQLGCKPGGAGGTVLGGEPDWGMGSKRAAAEEPYYEYSEMSSITESQRISYAAQGLVKTADGKEIAFEVSLNMSSAYSATSFTSGKESGSLIKLKDPLVINYGGAAASLTQTKFEFDLDFDGQKDRMSFAKGGSGFLALDKNGDGTINDGRELFGPQSGQGFSELAQYDTDGNMWIDEADEVYSKLRIWSKDENGNDQLFTLKELDVGAIFLGNTKTSMTMYDQTYNMQGQIQATGVFLKNSGGAGTVQHIDLAV